MRKTIIMISMVIGSSAGSYLPILWGGSLFSITSVFLGALGGLFGIWASFKITNNLE